MSTPNDPIFPDNRSIPLGARIASWSVLLGVLAVLFGASRYPERVEAWYIEGLGAGASRTLAFLSSKVPLSIAEWVLLGAIMALSLSLAAGLVPVARGRRSLANALAWGAVRAVDAVVVLVTVFYVVWGMSYARPPASERLELATEPPGDADAQVAELERLARAAQQRAAAAYHAMHGQLDAGDVTDPGDYESLDTAIDFGYGRVAEVLELSPVFASSRGPTKRLMGSGVLSWLSLGGFYFPYTGEANVNDGPPAWTLPMTIAHEKAHQRLVASEDEANFFGFLACVHSEDPAVRYAGWMHAERRLIGALGRVDRDAALALVEARPKGIQRDLRALVAYWSAYESWLGDLSSSINDVYLKVNRVEGGVKSYARSAQLIVGWARTDAGRERFLP